MTEGPEVVTRSMTTKKNARNTKAGRYKFSPAENDFFRFATQVALVFDKPEAAPLRARLFHEASAIRNQYRPYTQENLSANMTPWTAFLLRLILTCPRMLSRPPFFEWVLEDLEWILIRRRFDPRYDQEFWDAVDGIRITIRAGHPHDKALDYFRFETVHSLMNAPAQLQGLVEACGKEEAVLRAADMEERLFGKLPDRRVIYRSVKRVEKELEGITTLLEAQSSLSPPHTRPLQSEPEEHATPSPKHGTRSAHPKRERRK